MLFFLALAVLTGPVAAGGRPCTAGAKECPVVNCVQEPCDEIKCCRFRPDPDTTEGMCMTRCDHGEVGDDWEPSTPTSQPTSLITAQPTVKSGQSCDTIESEFHDYMSDPARAVCDTDADCDFTSVGCAFGMSLGGCMATIGQGFDRSVYNRWTSAWNDGGCCAAGCMVCACLPPVGTICEDRKCVFGVRETTSAPTAEVVVAPTAQPTVKPGQSCDTIESEFHDYMSDPARAVCDTDADCDFTSVGCAFGMSLGGCMATIGLGFDRSVYNRWTSAWNDGGCCAAGCMVCDCMPPVGTICEDRKCVFGVRDAVTVAPTAGCQPDPNPRCTEESAPVCADGVTYMNPCYASAMCYTAADWTVGECVKTTSAPTEASCGNVWKLSKCKKKLKTGQCAKVKARRQCQKTCGACGGVNPCKDKNSQKRCNMLRGQGKCSKPSVSKKCKKTCQLCA